MVYSEAKKTADGICHAMSYRHRRFAAVGYMNGPLLSSFFGHVLRSLGQFSLAQSAAEHCQFKIFSASATSLSHNKTVYCPIFVSWCVQCNVIWS